MKNLNNKISNYLCNPYIGFCIFALRLQYGNISNWGWSKQDKDKFQLLSYDKINDVKHQYDFIVPSYTLQEVMEFGNDMLDKNKIYFRGLESNFIECAGLDVENYAIKILILLMPFIKESQSYKDIYKFSRSLYDIKCDSFWDFMKILENNLTDFLLNIVNK